MKRKVKRLKAVQVPGTLEPHALYRISVPHPDTGDRLNLEVGPITRKQADTLPITTLVELAAERVR